MALTLDEAIQKAAEASYNLKIAQLDVRISQTEIKAARSEYFPKIQSYFNTEYLKDLEQTQMPVTAVGNNVIPSGTRYQNSLGVNMRQNLLDFGVAKRRVQIAKKDVLAKVAQQDQVLRDLKIKVVDTYTQALLSYKTIRADEAMLKLSQDLYQMKKRLYEAGTIPKVDVANEAIMVAQMLDEIEHYKDELQQQLQRLSYFTNEVYDIESTELADLQDQPSAEAIVFNETLTPEFKAYALEIDKKQKEIELLRRQALPQLSLYSSYTLYGFNPDQWSKSLQDLSQRNVSLGLNIGMPIFDGFKNRAAIEKATLEKEKLALQRDDRLAQLKTQAQLYEQQIEGFSVRLQTKATILNKTQDKLTMVSRLSDQQIVDQTQAIKEHIERIKKQLEVDKSLMEGVSALKKLKILAAG